MPRGQGRGWLVSSAVMLVGTALAALVLRLVWLAGAALVGLIYRAGRSAPSDAVVK